ncbi:MAG: type II toxin-antitoxin system prevent-host-death family antitoxin [Verrucomicrobiales bacterium]
MIQSNMHDAKSRLSELVLAAEAGEEVVICRRGTPSVRLVAIAREAPRRSLVASPRLKPIKKPGYDPSEPLSEEEWPAELR